MRLDTFSRRNTRISITEIWWLGQHDSATHFPYKKCFDTRVALQVLILLIRGVGVMPEGKVRCLNCFERISVPDKAKKLVCPKCGEKYVIAWRGPQPKIQGSARD